MAIDRDRQLDQEQNANTGALDRNNTNQETQNAAEVSMDTTQDTAGVPAGVTPDAQQDAGEPGETRMWNAQEVREAAVLAAAEWDARCEEQERRDGIAAETERQDGAALEADGAAGQDAHEDALDIPIIISDNVQDLHEPQGSKRGDSAGKGSKGKKAKSKKSGRGRSGKRSIKARIARLALGIAIVGILGTGIYYGWRYYQEEVLPGRQYEQAVELRSGGALDDAIQVFTALGDWGDAADQVLETRLLKARGQIDVGSYEDALVTLAQVGDYVGAGDLHTQDLIDEANQALSDIAYNKGLDLIKLYDYSGAADQFAAAQAYAAREDAAELQTACEGVYDEVYASSFSEGRDADGDTQMTMYLWVHSVITPGEAEVPLGMQSDLSTGAINANTFGQAYMNYVYYSAESDQLYTFSYAGSEKDAGDESRQVYLMAEFSENYEQVVTSKVYSDTGEVPAAPDIRTWNVVTDTDTISAVKEGIRARLTMDLIASGELDAETYGNADHSFEAIKAVDNGFTLKTAEEIAAEEAAESAGEDGTSDEGSADTAEADAAEVEAVLQASAEAEVNDTATEESAMSDDNAASEETTSDDSGDATADGTDAADGSDEEASDEEGRLDYASMTEEERKAKADELQQQEEDTRIAAQQEAIAGLTSDYAIMVDADTGEILVSKAADSKMYPASMTKIMTILIAAENVTDLTDRAEITNDIITYASERGLTTVGFSTGEQVTVADLMWGTALCSGADAAKALANYVAGSETNYVEFMNAKVAELGLTGTHFANCTGVYSDDNYTTPHDMALILYAAVQNPLARTVLSTRQYTTTFTTEHPAGITITNSFLRNMDQDQLPGIVLSAKTGFVKKSMFCAASYMIADDGEIYICVTGHADSSALCRADHASLYNAFAAPPSHTDMEKYLEEILTGESSNVAAIAAVGE